MSAPTDCIQCPVRRALHESIGAVKQQRDELKADVRLLGEAILNLRNAKGRHNTGIAYERLLAEFADFQLKHPLQ